MADNTTLNSGSGGDTIATDDIGGVKFQRVKLTVGADGTNDGDVASSNPLPVSGAVTITGSSSVFISNVPTVSISGSTSAVVTGTVSITGSHTVFVGNVPTVSISGSTSAVITGTVSITGSHTVILAANSGVDIGDVDVLSVIPGTGATNLGKAIDSAAGATDTGVVPLAIRDDALTTLTPAEGDYAPLRVGSTGALHVEIESGSVSASGTLSITGSHTVVTQGVAAHDAAVSGNPVLTGLEARTTNPTAVADGDAVRAMADDTGRQVVVPNAPRDLVTNNHVSLSVSTTTTLLAAGGAGVFRDLTMLTISNPAASAATVTIFDDHTTGTQAFKWELAADGGGVVLVFNTPYKAASANTGWGITSTETGVTATAQAIDTV